jgi:FAD/FMN-containing dehydrogenase
MDSLSLIAHFQKIIGKEYVLTDSNSMAPYLIDWRKLFRGKALAVLLPKNVDEVAALVKQCHQMNIAIIPQGGNTGLCGAATPDNSNNQVVISLKRLNHIREIDKANLTMTVEAGCILQNIQETAASANCLFPLSLGAEGSCMIGGNLSTNAGGTNVLRYGNMRDLCLGLEVVTAEGEIWHGLRGLRKDNTGYDLRNLFIGAEGTLGIITAAVIKLFPMPIAQWTALVAVPHIHTAIQLLNLFQSQASALLTGFEMMNRTSLAIVGKHFPQMKNPLQPEPNYSILIELSDHESEFHVKELFQTIIEKAFTDGLIEDAVIASNLSQANTFWQMREHITMAQVEENANLKHDITLPLSKMEQFILETGEKIEKQFPGIRTINFGHLGDGNLHYNFANPENMASQDFQDQHQNTIAEIVYEQVEKFGGSISAEHGIGQLKMDKLRAHKGEVAHNLMIAIKKALDPKNILNPNKVLPKYTPK